MRNKIAGRLFVAALIVMLGCGTSARMIALKSQSERSDVFREVDGSETMPQGYAAVTITAEIKTHLEDTAATDPQKCRHGTESYPFLINIEGQAVLWEATGQNHDLPIAVGGKTIRDPEAGAGMKYALQKKVWLAEGRYEVFLGLPEDHYCTVTDISVVGGKSYVLKYTPLYRHKTSPARSPSFMKGILRYDIVFEERVIH